MASVKGQMNCSKTFVFVALLMILTCSCSIGRVYMGSEIRYDPNGKINIGSTTKGEILEIFGPPDRIQKQCFPKGNSGVDYLLVSFLLTHRLRNRPTRHLSFQDLQNPFNNHSV